jgi:flavin-dependent dehydrogenase
VVGAFGVNSTTPGIFEDLGFGYKKPDTVTTAIAEISFDRDIIPEHFGDAIHLFLLPIKNIKFGAMIPKGTYVTLCLLGKDMNAHTVTDFLDNPVVRKALPETASYELSCRCLPKMNIKAPKIAYTDRVVMCGDAGSTRLFKDGIGAAYIMGKAAAKTAVFQGVSKQHFRTYYRPVYRSIITDNWFGRYLYTITDFYRMHGVMTRGMVTVVKDEQLDPDNPKRLSSILWDMFTGNELYKNIFRTAISMPMHLDIWRELIKILAGRGV